MALKYKSPNYVWLVFAPFLLIMIIAVIPLAVVPNAKANAILKNGQTAMARVTNYSEFMRENDVPKYRLEFTFTNSDGEVCTGRSKGAYSYSYARSLIENGIEVEIKYTDKGVCEVMYKDPLRVLVIVWYVVIAILALLIGAFLFGKIWEIRTVRISKNGNAGEAYFRDKYAVSTKKSIYYRIEYSYTNADGELTIKKTQPLYTESEALYLEKQKAFQIRYKGRIAVITEDLLPAAEPMESL